MNKFRFGIFVASVACLTTGSMASAQTIIKIGTQEPGGSFYSAGVTFAKLIDDNKAAGLTTEIIPRGGASLQGKFSKRWHESRIQCTGEFFGALRGDGQRCRGAGVGGIHPPE